MVLIEEDIPVGEMVPVRITGAIPYDLTGTAELGGQSVIGFDQIGVPST